MKPDYKLLKVFGSACYTHKMNRDRDKFGQRSRSCIFVCYPFGKKGWKLYDVDRNEFLVSRYVVFREDVFLFAESKIDQPAIPSSDVILDDRVSSQVSPTVDTDEQNVASVEETETETELPLAEAESVATEQQPVENLGSPLVSETSENLGRGRREKTQSVLLKDFLLYSAPSTSYAHHALPNSNMLSSSNDPCISIYPISNCITDDQFIGFI